MADQVKERPQQPSQAADSQAASAAPAHPATGSGDASSLPETLRRQPAAARPVAELGGNAPQTIQEAVPLASVESDPLAEAARHFRELQAKSAGVAGMHRPAGAVQTGAAQTGDVARDLLKDDGQLSSLALSTAAANWRKPDAALPTDMLADGDSAAARATARSKLRAVAPPEKAIDVEARPPDRSPGAPTFVDMEPDLSLPIAASSAPAPSSLAAETQGSALSSLVADVQTSEGNRKSMATSDNPDEMERARVLTTQAPILVAPSSTAPAEPSTPDPARADTAELKLPPFPAIDGERRLPAGPSGNLRLFAGLSVVIAAFAGSLVWVAMWRADSFNSGAEATIDISPEDMIETSAGGDTGTTVASAGNGSTVTATLMVRDTELLLAKLAFDPGPADGVLDDTTREAIRRYQQAAGLPETGEPSKELLDELQAVVAAIDGN
jgi:putative peptidoglycan binding protein